MNRSTHLFRGDSDRNQGLLLRLLVSLGLLLTVPMWTLAATVEFVFDKTGNQISQQAGDAAAAPVITAHPANQVLQPGATIGFSVSVFSVLPVKYQ